MKAEMETGRRKDTYGASEGCTARDNKNGAGRKEKEQKTSDQVVKVVMIKISCFLLDIIVCEWLSVKSGEGVYQRGRERRNA